MTEGLHPTTSVLVTCFGTSLPLDVKLWYQLYRVVPFYDKLRQYANCHRFNHLMKSCHNTKLSSSCAQSPSGDWASQQAMCINYKGSHLVSNKECPHCKRETQLQNSAVIAISPSEKFANNLRRWPQVLSPIQFQRILQFNELPSNSPNCFRISLLRFNDQYMNWWNALPSLSRLLFKNYMLKNLANPNSALLLIIWCTNLRSSRSVILVLLRYLGPD